MRSSSERAYPISGFGCEMLLGRGKGKISAAGGSISAITDWLHCTDQQHYVVNAGTGQVIYTPPTAVEVPVMMSELVKSSG